MKKTKLHEVITINTKHDIAKMHERIGYHLGTGKKINVNIKVEDLLFVCIPFSEHGTYEEKIYEKQKAMIEGILKLVGHPIFSVK